MPKQWAELGYAGSINSESPSSVTFVVENDGDAINLSCFAIRDEVEVERPDDRLAPPPTDRRVPEFVFSKPWIAG